MNRPFPLLIAALLVASSMQAAPTGYERRAFEGRYGLWSNVQCVSDSLSVTADTERAVLDRIEIDARSRLAGLGFPRICDAEATPAPATMVSVELEVRTVAAASGGLVYFVQMRAEMPDGEFLKKSFGQLTSWESTGKLGYTDRDLGEATLREAMGQQIDEFAAFMRRTRTMRDG